MARAGIHVLNGILTFLGIGITCTALWFFVQVYEITVLRNSNHYLLDYNVYFPQAIPWLFIFVGIMTICVSGCGFSGAKNKKKGLVVVYEVCLGLTIVFLLVVAIVGFVFADSKHTDNFIKDTIWDAYFQSKEDIGIQNSFGNIEKKLHCCGATSPRDYKSWRDNSFPQSCCDTYYHGFIGSYYHDCDFTNKVANERYGCSEVATQYARIVIKVLSAVSILTSVIATVALIMSVAMLRSWKEKNRVMVGMAAKNMSESEKVLI